MDIHWSGLTKATGILVEWKNSHLPTIAWFEIVAELPSSSLILERSFNLRGLHDEFFLATIQAGVNPYGMTYYLGLQGRGTSRQNPKGTGLEDLAIAEELGAHSLEL